MKLLPHLRLLFYILLFNTCTTSSLFACGPIADPYENRVSFFSADLFEDPLYNTFFWEAARHQEQLMWDATLAQKNRYNVEDWQRYFKGIPNVEDIAAVVYKADTLLLQKLYKQIAYGKAYNIAAAEWKNNALLQYLYKTKDIDFINYLVIAKRCEPYVVYDPWDDTEADPSKVDNLINTVLIKLQNCRTPFIKLRYSYQAIRLAHYTGRYEKAIELYTKYAAGIIGRDSEDKELINQSVIRYWTMALRSGAHKRMGDNAPAMYGFSRVFLESPDMKQVAIQNFEYTGEQDWQQTLKIASRRPGAASILWMMRGLKNKQLDLEVLQEMYKDLSESEFLEAMLVREVNKIEELMLSPAMTKPVLIEGENADTEKAYFPTNNQTSNASVWESIQDFFKNLWQTIQSWFGSDTTSGGEDGQFSLNPTIENTAYIQELKAFVDTARIAGNLYSAPLWGTVSAYLAYMLQDYDEAQTTLEAVGKVGATEKIKQQALLVYALADLAKGGRMNEGLENSFYDAIKDLPQPKQAYENFNVYSRTLMHLGQHYLTQGDIVKSFLCFNQAKEKDAARILMDFHASQSDLKTLQQLAAKANKTPFEAHLFQDSLLTENFILDVMATKLMREQQFETALKQYQQISPDYWEKSEKKETWFGLQYNTIKCSFDKNTINKYATTERCNKMEFAQKVVDLLQSAKEMPAESHFKLGNGFANTPFWGYSGNLWQGDLIWTLREFQHPVLGEYGVGTYPFNIPSLTDELQKSVDNFVSQYGGNRTAIYFYKKALENAKDSNRELGAKSAYLIKYCQENPQASIHGGIDKDPTYAKILKNEYGDTRFFEQILEECPDLKAYQ
ncbi:MAG: hypothetical protein ACPGVB_03330 [Chitinophagales bacterium]